MYSAHLRAPSLAHLVCYQLVARCGIRLGTPSARLGFVNLVIDETDETLITELAITPRLGAPRRASPDALGVERVRPVHRRCSSLKRAC